MERQREDVEMERLEKDTIATSRKHVAGLLQVRIIVKSFKIFIRH